MREATTRISLLIGALAAFVATPVAAEDGPANAWSAPSAESDSAVAAWATERLVPRSPAEPNPLRATPARPIVAAPVVAAPVAQVRYDQEPAANPLRGTEAVSTAPPAEAARLAFSDSAPAPRAAAAKNPFDAPTPISNPQPLRLEAGARSLGTPDAAAPTTAPPEPRSFEIAADNAPAPLPADRFAGDPPSDFKPIDRPQQPPQNRVATREAPRSFPANAGAPTPATHNSDFPFGGDAASEGAGLPGGSELEGPQQASLVVEKRGPEEARVGQISRFLISVRNTGRGVAENVVLRDEIPRGAQLKRTEPAASREEGRLAWRLGALAPGEERTVEVLLTPTTEGDVGSVATVSFETRASAAMRSTKPALAVRVRAAESVLLGAEQQIQIELHNPGTGVARNVLLLEDVPDALRHEAGPALELEIGSLGPGETRRMDLTLTAAQAGRVVNTVTAIADGDLRAEGSATFEVVAPSLAVAVDGPARRYLQRPATYEVSIENPGTAPAKDVRLVTHLPRGLEFVSANNLGEYDAQTHAVYWSLAELPESQRGVVEVVALPVTPGEHTLRVESEAGGGLKAAESRSVLVEGMASLAFDIRDLQDPIEVGDEAAYDVVVMNEGTKAAEGVRVTVDAPPGMRVVSAQGKTPHRQTDERVEFAPIDRLEPGVKVLYRVRLRGERPGDQRVTVAVASSDLRQPIRREESTRVFGDE